MTGRTKTVLVSLLPRDILEHVPTVAPKFPLTKRRRELLLYGKLPTPPARYLSLDLSTVDGPGKSLRVGVDCF